jgi:hypothetical protein
MACRCKAEQALSEVQRRGRRGSSDLAVGNCKGEGGAYGVGSREVDSGYRDGVADRLLDLVSQARERERGWGRTTEQTLGFRSAAIE